MKKIFIGIFSFCISAIVGSQFFMMSASQVPRFHGEEFAGGSESFIMLLIYCIVYIAACLSFAVKFSCSQKTEYIIRLLCFFGVTALIGFTIDRYILFGKP